MRRALLAGSLISCWLILGITSSGVAAEDGGILNRNDSINAANQKKAILEDARKEGRIVFWGVLTVPDFQLVAAAFRRRYPDIEVQYVRGGPERNVTQLFLEVAAGKYDVDLFQNTAVGTVAVKEKGLTDKYLSPQTKFLKRGLFDPGGAWVALHHTVVALGYNTKLVSKTEVPQSYQDLLKEKWKGKMSLDTEDYTILTGLELAWGEQKALDYLKKLGRQQLRLVRGHTSQAQQLPAGEFEISIGLYLHRIAALKSHGAPVDHVLLDPVISNPMPVTLMKRAPHPYAAALFLDWALSQEGQETITQQTGHFIARNDVSDRFGKIVGHNLITIGPETEEKGAQQRVAEFREIFGSR
jgi:iron(III) transport system substrate-binding protein